MRKLSPTSLTVAFIGAARIAAPVSFTLSITASICSFLTRGLTISWIRIISASLLTWQSPLYTLSWRLLPPGTIFDPIGIKGRLPRISQRFCLSLANNKDYFTDLVVLGKTFNRMKKNGFAMNLQEGLFDSPAHAQSKTCPD